MCDKRITEWINDKALEQIMKITFEIVSSLVANRQLALFGMTLLLLMHI